MSTLTLYYVTNRNHLGADRFKPAGYGTEFSRDGAENLRFGRVQIEVDDKKVARLLAKKLGALGKGDGNGLEDYFAECAETASIKAYPETLSRDVSEAAQKNVKLGSQAMFADVKAEMMQCSDVVLYVHGFNVSWHCAVGSALAQQVMLRHSPLRDEIQNVTVVLFTWPSDGKAVPWFSYRSDRTEAASSGASLGRGLLKARDFLISLRDRSKGGEKLCGQDMHLMCHSMGNFVLQNALARVADFTPGSAMPRLFEHIFLCAPDVDDNVLEADQPMGRLHELARFVSVYHNNEDRALVVSDYTKGNPDRLGSTGAARPQLVHNKVHQIDCGPLVGGLTEHSYYQCGLVNADIRASIDGWAQDDARRVRIRHDTQGNVWAMTA